MESLSILAVDDDPVIRHMLVQRLATERYNVVIAEDGTQAISQLQNQSFDVVITDLVLPGDLDGIGILEFAKKISPDTEVVVITAHSSVDTAVAAMKKGAADYLEKPINFDELYIRLDKIANIKSIVRNARDIGQAMQVTEQEAAITIQKLEMRIASLMAGLRTVKTLLEDEKRPATERLAEVLKSIDDL